MNFIPLPERVRPQTLDEYIGQQHLIGPDGVLSKLLKSKNIPSIIFWGPPGTGKTTLSKLIAKEINTGFYSLSAINSGVKEVREVIDSASEKNIFNNHRQPVLFIDEIHRFSKSQQDSLLGAVEKGVITLIGATTENPSFEVISPLLSRCQVLILNKLNNEELKKLVLNAIEKGFKHVNKKIEVSEWEMLTELGNGDARKTLNYFEIFVNSIPENHVVLTNDKFLEIIQSATPVYDKSGEYHYDIISAFIKSLRGSDPNAAVYWLALMLQAGEKPEFIARRMLILSSEDIGNANPNALLMADTCYNAVQKIGMPEARIILSQTAIYLACSVKSNSAYMAIEEALAFVKKQPQGDVPLHLRNGVTSLMKDIGYGSGYKYSHHYTFGDKEAAQEFLPENFSGKKFYEPSSNAREEEMRKYLKTCWHEKYDY